MKVCFEAQIMQNNIKSLRSMDKEARLVLEYSAEGDELVSNINKLHSAEKTIWIVITDEHFNLPYQKGISVNNRKETEK